MTNELDAAEGEACVPNIGPRQRRMRMRFGVAGLVVGGLACAIMVGLDASRGWRPLLLLPFWAGASGIFQAMEHT